MSAPLRTCARLSLLAGSVMLAAVGSALADDHPNLERGLPLRIESAYPIEYLGREYERTDMSEDRFRLVPRLELGLFPNTELTIESEFLLGEADDRGSGDVTLEGLYNFNQESLRLPALSLSGAVSTPTGEDSEGWDTTLEFLATKTIDDENYGQLHLNMAWTHNFERQDEERSEAYEIVLGNSRRLTPDLMLVTDFSRQWTTEEDQESNLVEAGLRCQLTPRTVVSAGAGFGIGDESPDVVGTFGIQVAF